MVFKGQAHLPCKAIYVSLFMVSLLNRNVSYSVILGYVSARKYFHNLYAFPDPTLHPHFKNLMESCKRRNSKPIAKTDIVTVWMSISHTL